jgi:hypothetical protein
LAGFAGFVGSLADIRLMNRVPGRSVEFPYEAVKVEILLQAA